MMDIPVLTMLSLHTNLVQPWRSCYIRPLAACWSATFTVGLDDLGGLFQPWWYYNSVIPLCCLWSGIWRKTVKCKLFGHCSQWAGIHQQVHLPSSTSAVISIFILIILLYYIYIYTKATQHIALTCPRVHTLLLTVSFSLLYSVFSVHLLPISTAIDNFHSSAHHGTSRDKLYLDGYLL